MSKTKSRINVLLFAAIGVGLSTVIVRSVLAGPQTVPTQKDISAAQLAVPPASGIDERMERLKGNYVAGNGIVEPRDREIKVAGEVAGRIKQLFVQEGQRVDQGAVLVELENGTEQAAVAAMQADLETARAELTRTLRGMRKEDVDAVVADTASLESRAALSKGTLARIETLAKSGASTPDELDRARRQAETDARSLEAAEARRRAALGGSRSEDILVARAKVAAASARLIEAQAKLSRLTVRAPISGEVLLLKVRAGEYYSPTAADPLLVMGDTSALRVRIDIDERDVRKVSLGAPALVTSNASPGVKLRGKVAEIGKRMGRKNIRTDDPVERIDTKILEVVVELEQRDGLVPGLRVIGYIEAK